jgi:hypothetical protein
MPTYPLVNQKTGEKKELSMTMLEYGQWKEENPEWDKDWSQGCAGVGEVGDWRNKLTSKHPSWNEVLGRAQKMPGSTVKKL